MHFKLQKFINPSADKSSFPLKAKTYPVSFSPGVILHETLLQVQSTRIWCDKEKAGPKQLGAVSLIQRDVIGQDVLYAQVGALM